MLLFCLIIVTIILVFLIGVAIRATIEGLWPILFALPIPIFMVIGLWVLYLN